MPVMIDVDGIGAGSPPARRDLVQPIEQRQNLIRLDPGASYLPRDVIGIDQLPDHPGGQR
jgi:hypothetical protein